MADVGEGPLTTPRADEWVPYDGTAGERTPAAGPWVKLPGGPVDGNGQFTGADFPDGPGPWMQC
jgi:hypothetical protein